MTWTRKVACALIVVAASAGAVRAQGVEENTVQAASEVLREIMAIPASCILESLLAEAHVNPPGRTTACRTCEANGKAANLRWIPSRYVKASGRRNCRYYSKFLLWQLG